MLERVGFIERVAKAGEQTRRLSVKYGVRRGVENLDLAVRPAEVFGFLGPNGAGKTTTICWSFAGRRDGVSG